MGGDGDGGAGVGEMYPIVEVPEEAAQEVEQLGTKNKFWYETSDGWRLCKFGRSGTGEDWAEKAAAELAGLLGLPHAAYDLGTFRGRPCVVSGKFFGGDSTLVHGNELLVEVDPAYAGERRYRQSAHTLEAIAAALEQRQCGLPPGWEAPEWVQSAFDLFAGYLLLDGWIGNTDRHHENWGVVEGEGCFLAPTFDHASALGCHLRDEERARRLVSRDRHYTPEAYAGRATSALFSHAGAERPMLTVEAFAAATAMAPSAGAAWRARLASVDFNAVGEVFALFPAGRCSAASADFSKRVLVHNRERLLSGGSGQ